MKDLKTRLTEFIKQYNEVQILTIAKVQKEFVNLYYEATGSVVSCSGCQKSVIPALNTLQKLVHSGQEIIPFKKALPMEYIIKNKTRIYVRCLGLVITPMNCTDNNAKVMLGEDPKRIVLFDKYPSNWEVEAKTLYGKLFKGVKETATEVAKTESMTSPVRLHTESENSHPLQPNEVKHKKRGRKPKTSKK